MEKLAGRLDTHEFTSSSDVAYDWSYEPWIFNTIQHTQLLGETGWYYFYAVNRKYHRVDAHICIHVENQIAKSPLKATFGGFQFSDQIHMEVLYEFIAYVEATLLETGITKLLISHPCDGYHPFQAAAINTFLLNQGYQIEKAELGTLIDIDAPYSSLVDKWERRKLNQAKDLLFERHTLAELAEVYDFILMCRKERGYELSITIDNLAKVAETFSDRFHLFSVMLEGERIAASITIDLGNKVLYNFHSAHPRKFDSVSPVVKLIEGIYEFGVSHQFRILDLGTSALDGRPNFSLLSFKMRLGGKPTMKYTFSKSW